MYLLGYDIGSSSVKASLVEAAGGRCVASAFYPKSEAPIRSDRPGWAEQDPAQWLSCLKEATRDVLAQAGSIDRKDIKAIGISYQMHGLVCVDKDLNVLRPSIIWCDSRAVPYGRRAFEALGEDWCLEHLLNSPGNFTAAKLAWVKDNEPDLYDRIWKVMLPGDYVAAWLTGTVCTTVSGLSEGIFWDFRENRPSSRLLDFFGFDESVLPEIRPTFGGQGCLTGAAARELGLQEGTPVTYRAGDQPNNALSLGVLNPGQIASTAGTSGVVYGVIGQVAHDPLSRVNAWMCRTVAPEGLGYAQMNDLAAGVPIGSDGISILPFGNGAERMLCNRETGCSIHGVNFNRHGRAHLLRAAQEGIVFSFCYGIEIMQEMGLQVDRIHAGRANLFLSPLFRRTLAGTSGATIELFDTDGSVGAARGAGIGAGIYRSAEEAFSTLERLAVIEPEDREAYIAAYERWKSYLNQ